MNECPRSESGQHEWELDYEEPIGVFHTKCKWCGKAKTYGPESDTEDAATEATP